MFCSLTFWFIWQSNSVPVAQQCLCAVQIISLLFFFFPEICQFSWVATRQFDLFQCSGYYNSSMQANDEILLKPVLLLKLSVENWERTKLMLKCNTTAVLYASVVSNSSTSKQLLKPFTPTGGPLWRLALLY